MRVGGTSAGVIHKSPTAVKGTRNAVRSWGANRPRGCIFKTTTGRTLVPSQSPPFWSDFSLVPGKGLRMVPTVREGHLARPEPGAYPPPTSARSLCSSISAASSCPRSSSASSRFSAGAPTGSMATDRRRFSTSSGIGSSGIALTVGEQVFARLGGFRNTEEAASMPRR